MRDSEFTCILYDKNNMRFYEVIATDIQIKKEHYSRSFIGSNYPIILPGEESITFAGRRMNKIIGLDDTTMKRIAKYNKDKELELLNAKIRVSELQLASIENKISKFKDKYNEILRFIDNDFNEPDDYEY